jgi:hypothetical protein
VAGGAARSDRAALSPVGRLGAKDAVDVEMGTNGSSVG